MILNKYRKILLENEKSTKNRKSKFPCQHRKLLTHTLVFDDVMLMTKRDLNSTFLSIFRKREMFIKYVTGVIEKLLLLIFELDMIHKQALKELNTSSCA